jgi:hypothetical protein
MAQITGMRSTVTQMEKPILKRKQHVQKKELLFFFTNLSTRIVQKTSVLSLAALLINHPKNNIFLHSKINA